MNTSKLDVLRNSISHNLTIASHSVHFNFFSVLDKLTYYNRVLSTDVGSKFQETLKLVAVRTYVHSSTRKHVRWTNQNRETYAVNKDVDIVHRSKCTPLRLVDTILGKHA